MGGQAATASRAPARIYIKVAMAAAGALGMACWAAVIAALTATANFLIISTSTHTATMALTLVSVMTLLP